MLLFRYLFITCLVFFSAQSLAADEQLAQARINIQKYLTGVPAENIQPSPIKGLYKVFMPPRVFYISSDGQFAVDGDVIDLKSGTNITQAERQKSLINAVNSVGEESMIIFKAPIAKHTINVFTDIDCGYCRKLHKAVSEYNKQGITVRYLAFPRAGIGSASYKKAVSVWCAEDKKAALTKAKSGISLPEKSCENPVEQHHRLGNMIGISGTPAIVLESGRIIPGFVPPARLSSILNQPIAKN
ncbi:MAG: DsbC family protein [Thioalkalispiraceae bacterium]|jgi:thiol:disulfide interchange protein DsbC